MKMKLNNLSGTVKVLIACLCITIIIFIVSFFYYGSINSAADPRTLPAKTLQLQYEKQLEEKHTSEGLDLLNQMLAIYLSLPDYKDITKDELVMNLDLASQFTQKSIDNYEKWLAENGSLSEQQIRKKITPFYDPKNPAFTNSDLDSVINKRINDIMMAQIETNRRLSVSLTNMGVVNRYQGNLELAKANYEKAILLWDKNYTAQDNLNMLMDLPVQKRSIISRLFPPEKIGNLEE